MGVRRCLARFLTSLAFRCALQRVQTVPAAIHSGRIPPSRHPLTGDGRLRQTPPPHRTWSVSDASSQPQLNLHLIENERNEDRLNSSGLHSAHLNIQFHINIKYKYICGRVRPRDERLVYTPHCPPAVPAASSPAYLKYFTPDSNIFISCSP